MRPFCLSLTCAGLLPGKKELQVQSLLPHLPAEFGRPRTHLVDRLGQPLHPGRELHVVEPQASAQYDALPVEQIDASTAD